MRDGATEWIGLGILLFVTTILGRIVSGLYGWAEAIKPTDRDELSLGVFSYMELAVYFLEDGASILVLAKNSATGGEMNIVQKISLYLTILCGLCYLGYFVFFIMKIIISSNGECFHSRFDFRLCTDIDSFVRFHLPGIYLNHTLFGRLMRRRRMVSSQEDLRLLRLLCTV